MSRHWLIHDHFYPGAKSLRRYYDQQFADPLQAHAKRFVWDYWHVPGQYSLLRTPAFHYFPQLIYRRWHEHLVQWGREVLGCHDISPPWLSCYIQGCEQELHADHPHGPWAFVFSLTPWTTRKFSGGETCLFRPSVLQNWAAGNRQQPTESEQLMARIAPRFNRLTVFDPRLPHAVRAVHGSGDPRLGRLVMHGWFVQPRPFFKGPLKESQVAEILHQGLQTFGEQIADQELTGYVSLKIKIQNDGQVHKMQLLTNTLVGPPSGLRRVNQQLKQQIRAWRFPKARQNTVLTLPIRFGL